MCNAEVATEDTVVGDKESKGLIENADVQIRGLIRTIKCHIESNTQEPLSDESPILLCLVEHAGCIFVKMSKGRDGKTPFERLNGKKRTQEIVPFGENVLAEQVSSDPMNRINLRWRFGIWLGMRQNSAECFICQWVYSELVKSGHWNVRADGTKKLFGKTVREDPIPIPPLPFEGARIQGERVTKQDVDKFGATVGCPGCKAIKDNRRTQPHSYRCRERIEGCLRITPQGGRRGAERSAEEKESKMTQQQHEI